MGSIANLMSGGPNSAFGQRAQKGGGGTVGGQPIDPATGLPFSFWDQQKLTAAQAAQGKGADGRTVLGDQGLLSALNPLSGVTQTSAAGTTTESFGDGGGVQDTPFGAGFSDGSGNRFSGIAPPPGQDPNGSYFQYTGSGQGFQNPTGGGGDRAEPTYKLNPDGTATPVDAGASYQASEWVTSGRTIAEMAAVLGTVGVGGAALEAAGGIGGLGGGGAQAAAAASDAGGGAAVGGGAVGESGLAGTGLAPYEAYAGPGSAGYQVAGDVAVAPAAGGGAGDVAAAAFPDAGLPTGVGAAGTSITGSTGAIGTAGEAMSAGAATGGGGSGVFGSGLSIPQIGQLASSAYGAFQGSQLKSSAAGSDPFAPYRAGYAQQLSTLMKDPSSITSQPGYQAAEKAGEQALTRNLSSQGLTGSGTAAEAIPTFAAKFEDKYYQEMIQTLAGLGGANINNAGIALQGQAAGDNTINSSINNLIKIWQASSGNSGGSSSGWLTDLFGG